LLQGPFDIALLGANKQVLRVRIPRLRSSDLKIQFAATTTLAPPGPGNSTANATAPAKGKN